MLLSPPAGPRCLLGGGRTARSAFGAHRLPCCSGTLRRGALRRSAVRLPRERFARHRVARFELERFGDGAGYSWPPYRLAPALTRLVGVFRAVSRSLGGLAPLRRRQVDAGATRLGQA